MRHTRRMTDTELNVLTHDDDIIGELRGVADSVTPKKDEGDKKVPRTRPSAED